MLQPWLSAFPATATPIAQEIDDILGYKLTDLINNGPNKTLNATIHSQPAIMATSILILRILEKEFDFKTAEVCDVALGHSLGEFAALVAAGCVSFADSLYLCRHRAEVMTKCTLDAQNTYGGEYGMVGLITEPPHLAGLIGAIESFTSYRTSGPTLDSPDGVPTIQQVTIGNVNSKSQIVLSGHLGQIRVLLTHLRSFGGHDPRAVVLKSDAPFHSPIMGEARRAMQRMLSGKSRVKGKGTEDIVEWPGKMQVVSNVTARPIESKEELKDLWGRQAVETVRWWDSIRYLDQEQKVRRWIGVGPGKVGRNLVGKEVGMRGKDVIKGGGVWSISDPREIEEVLRGLEETEHMMTEDEASPRED